MFLFSAGLTGVGVCGGVLALESVPAVVAARSLVAAVVTVTVGGPPHVRFGTLETFGDLAVAVAGGTGTDG